MNTDPIADLLTRIRNAFKAEKENTIVPYSRLKMDIVEILEKQGFIEGHKLLQDKKIKNIKILIPKSRKFLTLTRISKPGRRVFKKAEEITSSLNGLGIYIVSTSKGVMTGEEARNQKIGGELLCEVY